MTEEYQILMNEEIFKKTVEVDKIDEKDQKRVRELIEKYSALNISQAEILKEPKFNRHPYVENWEELEKEDADIKKKFDDILNPSFCSPQLFALFRNGNKRFWSDATVKIPENATSEVIEKFWKEIEADMHDIIKLMPSSLLFSRGEVYLTRGYISMFSGCTPLISVLMNDNFNEELRNKFIEQYKPDPFVLIQVGSWKERCNIFCENGSIPDLLTESQENRIRELGKRIIQKEISNKSEMYQAFEKSLQLEEMLDFWEFSSSIQWPFKWRNEMDIIKENQLKRKLVLEVKREQEREKNNGNPQKKIKFCNIIKI